MGLVYEKEGKIAEVGLNRPKEKNALDPQILMDMHLAWQDINADDSIRVAILYSLSAGYFLFRDGPADCDPHSDEDAGTGNRSGTLAGQGRPACCEAMLKPSIVKKPVIAAVNGYCLTGGFETIMGADLRIASEDAIFQMRESSLGIMPTGGSNVYLPRMLTPCRGLEILLTASNFSAKTLLEWGFLNRVMPRGRSDERSRGDGRRIAGNGPWRCRALSGASRESQDMPYAEAFKKELEIGLPIFASLDAREGIMAQKENGNRTSPASTHNDSWIVSR